MATTEHSPKFELVKYYYDTIIDGQRLWSIDRVWNAVGKWITEAEYFEITGFVYPAKS